MVNVSKEDKKWSLQIHEEVRIPLANSPVRQQQRQEPQVKHRSWVTARDWEQW